MAKKIFITIFILLIAIIIYILKMPEGIKPIVYVIGLAVLILILLFKLLPKDNDYIKNLILVSGIVVTMISWFIIGYLNNESDKRKSEIEFKRSTSQSKRDLKVKFLIDAYFRLENSDHRDTFTNKVQQNMYDYIYIRYTESALTSIQLLCSDSTIRLANKYIMSGGEEHFNDLLISLRNELRKDLELPMLPNLKDYSPTVFRTYRKIDAPNRLTPDQQFQLTLRLCEYDQGLIK
jgi:hypothetical protein